MACEKHRLRAHPSLRMRARVSYLIAPQVCGIGSDKLAKKSARDHLQLVPVCGKAAFDARRNVINPRAASWPCAGARGGVSSYCL